MSTPTIDGWAVLELMGHRRIAGRITEVTIGGAGFLRIDVPSPCAGGAGASWCPVHGTCICPADAKEQPDCPLHGANSKHADEDPAWAATQFYPPTSVYCLTPTTEEIARAVAAKNMPQPVHEWELPKKLNAASVGEVVDTGGSADFEDDDTDDAIDEPEL
jgi:hypothetical protein